jgi:hypothetical protein
MLSTAAGVGRSGAATGQQGCANTGEDGYRPPPDPPVA